MKLSRGLNIYNIYIYGLSFESTSSRWIHCPRGEACQDEWIGDYQTGEKIGGGRLGRWGGCGELMNPARLPYWRKGFWVWESICTSFSVGEESEKKNQTAATASLLEQSLVTTPL